MKSKNVETLLQEREDLQDLLEDIMGRIEELREEMLTELDDLEYMIAENSRIKFH
jgi:vacuolar-type H+-ATPase subunit I/STV1